MKKIGTKKAIGLTLAVIVLVYLVIGVIFFSQLPIYYQDSLSEGTVRPTIAQQLSQVIFWPINYILSFLL